MTPEERVGMLDEIPEWGRSLFEKCANFRNTFCAEIADLRFPIILSGGTTALSQSGHSKPGLIWL
jgi:hypothetical protein